MLERSISTCPEGQVAHGFSKAHLPNSDLDIGIEYLSCFSLFQYLFNNMTLGLAVCARCVYSSGGGK